MNSSELQQYLLRLQLTLADAALLLGVTTRTLRRWLDGEEVSGPAQQALRAWIKLHERNIPWRPDSVSVDEGDEKAICRYRDHAIASTELINAVEARGGPLLSPWDVDVDRGRATFGPFQVTFYKLRNGGFSISHYTRKDGDPDVQRDRTIIEDAAYCIGQVFGRLEHTGQVTLYYHDRSPKAGVAHQESKDFLNLTEAISAVCLAINDSAFVEPFITKRGSTELVMNTRELHQECARRTNAPATLEKLAQYVRDNSDHFVRSGPVLPAEAFVAQRVQRIKKIADEIALLATDTRVGRAGYRDFESLLGELHSVGFFPATELVSDVAKALVQ